jgi:hypothetical protein
MERFLALAVDRNFLERAEILGAEIAEGQFLLCVGLARR